MYALQYQRSSRHISAKGVAVSESLQRDSAKQKRTVARNSNVYDHQRLVLKSESYSVVPTMTLCMRFWNSVPISKRNYAGKIGNKQNVDVSFLTLKPAPQPPSISIDGSP